MKIFAGLIIIIVLCAATIVLITYVVTPSHIIIAEKLSNKPEEYFVITTPDPVLLNAISHVGETVSFNSFDETEFDELVDQHGTGNIEYLNNFYFVGFPPAGDPSFNYVLIYWVSLFGFVISITLLIYFSVLKNRGQRRDKNNHLEFTKNLFVSMKIYLNSNYF